MAQLRIDFDIGPNGGPEGHAGKAPEFAALPQISLVGSIASGIITNLAAWFAPLPKVPLDWRYAPMFRSARLEAKPRGRSLFTSVLLHAGVLACLVTFPSLPGGTPARRDAPNLQRTVLYYSRAQLLPNISPPVTKRSASHATTQRKAERPRARKLPEFAMAIPPRAPEAAPVQTIVSKPPQADNRRQTIIQPEAPEMPKAARIELPNLVYWRGVAVPPQPVVSEATRELARIALPKMPVPNVAPPRLPQPPPEPPKLAVPQRNLSDLAMAALAPVQAPKLPVPLPDPPKLSEPRRNLSEMTMTALAPAPAAPPATPPRKRADLPAPPSASSTVVPVNVAGQQDALRNLIAVSAAPAPPDEKVKMPEGNRAGDFAVSPNAGEEASPEERGGKNASAREGPEELAGRELAEIRVPNLSVTGGRATAPAGPAGEARATRPPERMPEARRSPLGPPDDALRKLIASTARPSLLPTPGMSTSMATRETPRETTRDREIEAGFFGRKRVYTLAINMPNLTSGSGSWVLHFAELAAAHPEKENSPGASEELSSPVALRKVDPRYEPSAVRERVEGIVLLAARILRDGKVAGVHVLQGLDPRLDASAAEALAGWQFSPATKHGAPVDLEVVVQIPFRLPTF